MDLTRRDFNRLTTAAFGGIVTGTIIGCGSSEEPDNGTGDSVASGDNATTDNAATDSTPAGDSPPATDKTGGDEIKLVGGELPEKNACLGLNQCKEYGKNGGEHECAGQSTCATVSHECRTMNECKYLGACDGKVAANECKGQGGCQVPMTPGEELWKQARAAFEKRMKAKGTAVGMAPLPDAEGS